MSSQTEKYKVTFLNPYPGAKHTDTGVETIKSYSKAISGGGGGGDLEGQKIMSAGLPPLKTNRKGGGGAYLGVCAVKRRDLGEI